MLTKRLEQLRNIDIYPVITESFCGGRSALDTLDAVLAGGARMVQLREKEMNTRRLYYLAVKFRERTAAAGALLIINDHLDIALAVDADGVHLGQTDLPAHAARNIAPDMILGASTHSLEEALVAQQDGVSYINIGPIFTTQTKQGLGVPVGPDLIRTIAPHLSIPFTVMGGINKSNIQTVLDAGAQRIAMVTAITQAENICETTSEFRKIVLGG